ncbi:MAG: hypothetical protein K2M72_09645 [Paramuribaculum sp.]|nr:hypothetical protein [Paramuribaculum sp.]
MKHLLLILTLAAAVPVATAQKTAMVTATYTYYAPESMSVEEAKHIALDRAKTDAIAAEFGTTVTQSNTVVTTNTNGVSDTRLYSAGGSEVVGEWIETTTPPSYDISYDRGVLTVNVTVKGRIKEIDRSAPDIEIATYRNAISPNNLTEDFRDGDDFYMTATPSTDGFLVAYLLDEKCHTVYRILPYQQAKERNVKLDEGITATFFSTDEVDAMTRAIIDSYSMTCDNPVEFNRLYILFSESPISVSNAENRHDDDMPFEIDEDRFYNWLLKKRSTQGIRVIERPLKITALPR